MLDFDLFTRVIDEAGPSLGRIDFFNYGEAFLHKRAVEMCEYIKTQLPAHLPLHEHQRPGVHRGAGAAPRALGHRRGDLLDRRRDAGDATCSTGSAATSTRRSRNLRALADEKRRSGRDVPFINWRYILFTLERQRRGDGRSRGSWRPRSASIGCAGRSPITPRTPSRGGSCRARRTTSASGTRSGTTTTSATRSPAPRRARAIDVRDAAARRCRSSARRGTAAAGAHARAQPVDARRSRRRPATAAGSCASARSCARADGTLIDRDYARAWLPHDARRRRARPTCAIEIPAPDDAGTLRAEVRPGERRDRLVRALRVADHDAEGAARGVSVQR